MSLDIAYISAFRGDADRAFEWLEKFVSYQEAGVAQIPHYPMFANLHDDPRWMPLLRRLQVAPEQLAAIRFDVKIPK